MIETLISLSFYLTLEDCKFSFGRTEGAIFKSFYLTLEDCKF